MITSRRNPIVQRARAVASSAKTAPPQLCFVEGVRLVEEWLHSQLEAEVVLVSESLAANPRGPELLATLELKGLEHCLLADDVFDSISNVRQSQGIAAVIRRPVWRVEDLLAPPAPLIIIAAGLQDPGNLGTIIRTAHAAGAHGIAATAGTVSPFNAKCIRASAGSALHLPVVAEVEFDEIAAAARAKGVRLLACSPEAPASYLDAALAGGVALVFGQEGSGLPAAMEAACDLIVRIPIAPGVDSLNVGSSAAVILLEAARQRGSF